MNRLFFYLTVSLFWFGACQHQKITFDASGTFEAREVVVSAEANGTLIEFNLEEGQDLTADELVGRIDCEDILLQKAQIEASVEALKLKRGDAAPELAVIRQQIEAQNAQISTLRTQYEVMVRERDRVKKLVSQEAAPGKQLDDIQGQVDVLASQIEAARSQITVLNQQMDAQSDLMAIRNRGIMSEEKPLLRSITRIENQLGNCDVFNPINGKVLAKYAEQHEYVNMGKPLYKIADLNDMILRAYVSGDQLSSIQLDQEVKVLVDKNQEEYKSYSGKIIWISDKAEFTPKTIQTKNERANLVYAIKIAVENDGFIRLGMYGEVQI